MFPAVLHRALSTTCLVVIATATIAIATRHEAKPPAPAIVHCPAMAIHPPVTRPPVARPISTQTITRRQVNEWLADPLPIARAARIIPTLADGKPIGFKLYAIHPGSVFDQYGFHNGDTVVSINGLDLTSPDKALELYSRIRETSDYNVSIIRRGQPMTLHYVIAP
jgi:general secretion pathway protein C